MTPVDEHVLETQKTLRNLENLVHVNKTPQSCGSVGKGWRGSPGHVSCVSRQGGISEEFGG